MSVYLVAVVVAFVIAVGGAARVGLPALDHWKHQRCLVRTAVLERELGIPLTNPKLLPRPKVTPQAAADRWSKASATRPADYYNTAARIEAARRKIRAAESRFVSKPSTQDDYYRPQWRRYS